MREPTAEFEVWQDGMMVASGSGPRDRAMAEMAHYATVYGQDGPVAVKFIDHARNGEE